jgi:hypothetical protein
MTRTLLTAALCLATVPAYAQFLGCSQTVGLSATPVVFSPRTPVEYLEICNAHASQTLGVNVTGGAAVIGAAGTRTLAAGACWAWRKPTPQAVSLIGSAAGTTTACQYQ